MPGKTDFLRLNAYTIKDLIKRKLSLDTKFTDQLYEGSNLAVLIDIFSYMAQSLVYMLNNAASESMFVDTQMYENMNRLCNFIGYSPKGMTPATVEVSLDDPIPYEVDGTRRKWALQQYSCVKANSSVGNGSRVCYSVADSVRIVETVSGTPHAVLYNGIWRTYPVVFTATGDPWETFTLDTLRSNAITKDYVAHGFMDVYAVVWRDNAEEGDRIKEVIRYKYTDLQLFKVPLSNTSRDIVNDDATDGYLYNGDIDQPLGRVFNLKLNERYQYQITFGDGSMGATLPRGASVYVVYLDTDGPNAAIEAEDIYRVQLQQNTLGLTKELFNAIINAGNDGVSPEYYVAENEDVEVEIGHVTNVAASSKWIPEESVDDIRNSAPNWFRMGNRLVTKEDYEYFLRNSPVFKGEFGNVKCMNNWEYVSTFYRWLYNLGTRAWGDPRHYLNQNRIVRNYLQIADPADCNNIYLWVKTRYDSDDSADEVMDSQNNLWKAAIQPLKDLTHEPVFLSTIPVQFCICGAPETEAKTFVSSPDAEGNIDVGTRSYLEVTIDDASTYATPTIVRQVACEIRKFFDNIQFQIGGYVNFNKLVNAIMDIDGVSNLRTVYVPLNADLERDPGAALVHNGVCFATWTSGKDDLIDAGADMEVSNTGRSLEPFQHPRLANDSGLERHIVVIKRSMNSLERVQY